MSFNVPSLNLELVSIFFCTLDYLRLLSSLCPLLSIYIRHDLLKLLLVPATVSISMRGTGPRLKKLQGQLILLDVLLYVLGSRPESWVITVARYVHQQNFRGKG